MTYSNTVDTMHLQIAFTDDAFEITMQNYIYTINTITLKTQLKTPLALQENKPQYFHIENYNTILYLKTLLQLLCNKI